MLELKTQIGPQAKENFGLNNRKTWQFNETRLPIETHKESSYMRCQALLDAPGSERMECYTASWDGS